MLLEKLSRETGVDLQLLALLVKTASRRYKTYFVPKRKGGLREINQPAAELKFLQRWVVRNFVSRLPVASCVTAYGLGTGILQNAKAHASNSYLLKMDLANFFPSIKDHDIRILLRRSIVSNHLAPLDDVDIDTMVRIVCRDGELTIGAPSSPAISNAILFPFDQRVLERCGELGVTYTRYADDLAFSTDKPQTLVLVQSFVRDTLARQASPRFEVNDEKTVFTSRKRNRSVTGLVLTSTNQISIGRDQKRKIRALCHQFGAGRLSLGQASYLRGYLAFVSSVEPQFVETLNAKYGAELIQRILGQVPLRRKPVEGTTPVHIIE